MTSGERLLEAMRATQQRERMLDIHKGNKSYGGKTMQTKSRYEVIAELEEKKRQLMMDKDVLDDNLKRKQRQLKELKRQVEDKEEEVQDFEKTLESRKETIDALIKSTEDSLNRFAEMNKKS